jgi:hypothetical protein
VDHYSAGEHHTAMATSGSEIVTVDAQFIAGGFNNRCNAGRDAANAGFTDSQRPFHDAECGDAAHIFKEKCGGDAGEGAFNLADATDGAVANGTGSGWFKRNAAFFRQAEYQRLAGIAIGRFYLHHHAAEQATDQGLAESAERARMRIGNDGDARTGETDGVDGVQEFCLGGTLVGKEVHVIKSEEVQFAHARPERFDVASANRLNVIVGELLAGGVANALIGEARSAIGAQALQQVRLSNAATAVQENAADAAEVVLGKPARGLKRDSV